MEAVRTWRDYGFRKAVPTEAEAIWEILQGAIARRKADGSQQWQDGYPNPRVIANDMAKDAAYVLTQEREVVGYAAVMVNGEPAYDDLEGEWLTHGDYMVVHRVAVSEKHLGKGLARIIFAHLERHALSLGIHSIKVDTNFDNAPMLHILDRLGYTHCGGVTLRGAPRLAFEKVLSTGLPL